MGKAFEIQIFFFLYEERHKKNLPDCSSSANRNDRMIYFLMVLYLYHKKFYSSLLWRHKTFTADRKLILFLKCCQSDVSPQKSCLLLELHPETLQLNRETTKQQSFKSKEIEKVTLVSSPSLTAITVFTFYYTAIHLPFSSCAITMTWSILHIHYVLLIQSIILSYLRFFES